MSATTEPQPAVPPRVVDTQPAPAPRRRGPVPGTVLVTSDALFADAVEVQIEHRGGIYRLKQTSLGKLILTK